MKLIKHNDCTSDFYYTFDVKKNEITKRGFIFESFFCYKMATVQMLRTDLMFEIEYIFWNQCVLYNFNKKNI